MTVVTLTVLCCSTAVVLTRLVLSVTYSLLMIHNGIGMCYSSRYYTCMETIDNDCCYIHFIILSIMWCDHERIIAMVEWFRLQYIHFEWYT